MKKSKFTEAQIVFAIKQSGQVKVEDWISRCDFVCHVNVSNLCQK